MRPDLAYGERCQQGSQPVLAIISCSHPDNLPVRPDLATAGHSSSNKQGQYYSVGGGKIITQ